MYVTNQNFENALNKWRLMVVTYQKYRNFLSSTNFDANYDYSQEFSDEI